MLQDQITAQFDQIGSVMGASGVSITSSTEFIQLKNMLRDVALDTMMPPAHGCFDHLKELKRVALLVIMPRLASASHDFEADADYKALASEYCIATCRICSRTA